MYVCVCVRVCACMYVYVYVCTCMSDGAGGIQVRRDTGLQRRQRRGGLPLAGAAPVPAGPPVPVPLLRDLHPHHLVLRWSVPLNNP